jgi:hypothetical protein
MAVENKYVNADVVAGKKAVPAFFNSDEARSSKAIAAVDAADDDGSIYRILRVNANMVLHDITVTNDAITGGTDYDIGLYNVLGGSLGGTVVDADAFADGLDVSSARAEGSGISGLSAVAIADSQKRLWEFDSNATEADHPAEYDIAITANTVGTASGNVAVKALFVQG